MYGREWQLGYDKLPPLPWWLVEVAYQLVGHDFAYYLLAQIAVAAGFTFVFLTARALVGTTGALVSVLIVDGLHYFNYTSAKFNHDVVQLPFWALAGFVFHRALRGRQNADWLLLGLAVGIALWAKYFVAVLAIPLGTVCPVRPRGAPDAEDAGALYRARRRARHHGAASGLAGEQRFPALHLCRAPRAAVARADRPRLASATIRYRPIVLSAAVAADRDAAVFAALSRRRAVAGGECRRPRPPHRRPARLRTRGDGPGTVGAERPRHRRHVGLSAVAVPRPVDRAHRAARTRRRAACPPVGDLGCGVHQLRRSPSSSITRCCRNTTTVTARCSIPAPISPAKSRIATTR